MAKCFSNSLPRPTLEPYYFMNFFIYTSNLLFLPMLIQHKVCSNIYDETICGSLGKDGFETFQNDVQQEAATWLAFLPLSALIPAFFVILVLGPLSDVIGKKKLMILPPFIFLIQNCVVVVLCYVDGSFSPAVYFLPFGLTGVFGEGPGVTLLSAAYLADITRPEERTFRFMILESVALLSALSAAGHFGLSLSEIGYIGAFAVNAVVCAINLAYTIFLLPSEKSIIPKSSEKAVDSLDSSSSSDTEENQNSVKEKQSRKTVFTLLRNAVNFHKFFHEIKKTLSRKDTAKTIYVLLVLYAMSVFISRGENYMVILFLKHAPFNLKPMQISYFGMTLFVLRSLGVVAIPYICMRYLKIKDTGLLIIGFASQVAYFGAFGFSVNTIMLFAVLLLSMGLPVSQVTIRAMLSKLVDSNQHGTVVSMAQTIDVLSAIVACFLPNIIYSATVKLFPGLAFCFIAMVALIGLIVAIVLRFKFRPEENYKICDGKQEEQHSLMDSISDEKE